MYEIINTDNIMIENLIYEIRGKQVMLDSDLARLYDVETKRINEAVKNNLKKFPERFSWILTEDESRKCSRSKISTLNKSGTKRGYNVKYLPRVFTEQGVAMLATILRSEKAIQISIRIMDAFVNMRHHITSSENRLSNVESKVLEHDKSIKLLQEIFGQFEEKKKTTDIYFNGQTYDAYSMVQNIFKKAKKELIIIDGYADNTILDIIKRLKVKVIIITKENKLLTTQDIDKYNSQYDNLKVIFNDTYHDRYFILDKNIVYHCGTSVNKIGIRTFSINLMSDKDICEHLINKIKKDL